MSIETFARDDKHLIPNRSLRSLCARRRLLCSARFAHLVCAPPSASQKITNSVIVNETAVTQHQGCGCCPHPRAPGALALSLDRERDLEKQEEGIKKTQTRRMTACWRQGICGTQH